MLTYGLYDELIQLKKKAKTEEQHLEVERLKQIITDRELYEVVENAGEFLMHITEKESKYKSLSYMSKGQWLLCVDDFARINHQKQGQDFWKEVLKYVKSLPR